MKRFFILATLLCVSYFSYSQISLTPAGTNKVYAPLVTVSNQNTNAISLLGTNKRDTVKANTFINPSRPYRFRLLCTITTPLLSIPTLTIGIKFGSATLNVMSGTGLIGSLNTVPFVIEGIIYPITPTSQYVYATVTQTNGTVANLSLTNSEQFAIWSLSTTSDLLFDITATYGGLTVLGNTQLTSRVFERLTY